MESRSTGEAAHTPESYLWRYALVIAPYRENYVHQILIFFVRNSFESTIEDRPVRIQIDRTGPVQLLGDNALVCNMITPNA